MRETEVNKAPEGRLVRQRPPAEGPTVTQRTGGRRRKAEADEPEAGWQQLVLRNRYGVDHDCTVLNAHKEQSLYITSDFFFRTTGEVRQHDRDGATLYVLRGRFLDLPRHMVIRQPDGTTVARVRAKRRAPLDSPVTVRLASGAEWETTGSLAKRQYELAESGRTVIRVDQKWVQIRDSCKVEVVEGIDPALASAVVWAIDELLADG